MAKQVFNALNMRYQAQITAPEFVAGNDFLAVSYVTPSVVEINGVSWGYVYGSDTDNALHLSGWMAILENVILQNTDVGFSVQNLGIDGTPGRQRYLSYMARMGDGFEGSRSEDYSSPIVISAGQGFSVVVNKPFTSAAIVNTMFLTLTVRASVVEVDSSIAVPRPRGPVFGKQRR